MNQSQNRNRWLLPEGIEEVLPPEAARLDHMTRDVVDLFSTWGYRLVIPPLIEYLESLLSGTGEDLELQTFKVTDLLSGRMLGIRADTTPQVARIDAHNLKLETPTRLCYAGPVLHTRPASSGGTRSPVQVGAELYGHAGMESDVEILSLMLETLNTIGIDDLHIDLGHIGIFRGLVGKAGLDDVEQNTLFDILQRKAMPELREFLEQVTLPDQLNDIFISLIDWHGGDDILQQAHQSLKDIGGEALMAVEQLATLSGKVRERVKDAPLYFDLAELRGYHYHSGVMFAAYVPDCGDGIAFGGRYDDVGSFFGRARPATGFSLDLKSLMGVTRREVVEQYAIFAPWSEDQGLLNKIAELRQGGDTVIMQLPDQTGGARDMQCDRELVQENNEWVVQTLS